MQSCNVYLKMCPSKMVANVAKLTKNKSRKVKFDYIGHGLDNPGECRGMNMNYNKLVCKSVLFLKETVPLVFQTVSHTVCNFCLVNEHSLTKRGVGRVSAMTRLITIFISLTLFLVGRLIPPDTRRLLVCTALETCLTDPV